MDVEYNLHMKKQAAATRLHTRRNPFAGREPGAVAKPPERNGRRSDVSAATLIECICAMHLTSYVRGLGDHRGGLWLVGPPGVMKSTFVDFLEDYENVISFTDLNSKSLMGLKGQLSIGSLRTLILPDFQKLYERDPRTAANVEGSIRAFVEEGYRGASFEATEVLRFKARATVIGAMTSELQEEMWKRWTDSGFARRFLWCLIRLDDPDILMRAVEEWQLQDFGELVRPNLPTTREIENNLTKEDRQRIRPWVRHQPKPNNFCFELLCKIAVVLKWHYGRRGIAKDALETVEEFSGCLGTNGKEGANIVLGGGKR